MAVPSATLTRALSEITAAIRPTAEITAASRATAEIAAAIRPTAETSGVRTSQRRWSAMTAPLRSAVRGWTKDRRTRWMLVLARRIRQGQKLADAFVTCLLAIIAYALSEKFVLVESTPTHERVDTVRRTTTDVIVLSRPAHAPTAPAVPAGVQA